MTENSFDRITVVETIYHRPYMDETLAVDSRFSRIISSGEQPYQRQNHKPNTTATEEWKQLDCGWLKDNVGMLVITNDEGKFFEVYPTEEEKEEIKLRILEIAYEKNPLAVWYVPPTESFRGCPSDPELLWIRCQHGTAKYTLTVLPK